MRKERGDVVEKRRRESGFSMDEMFDVVDELFLTLDDDEEAPVEEEKNNVAMASAVTTKTKKHSASSSSRQPMMADVASLAELVAEKTPVARSPSSSSSLYDSSSSSSSISAGTAAVDRYEPRSHTIPTITITTSTASPQITALNPLHSNPPTATEIAHARALSAKHARRHAAPVGYGAKLSPGGEATPIQ